MTPLIVACVATLAGILGWAGWIAGHRDRAEGRHSASAAQLAEDERFWAHEATIARRETWSQPPADKFPPLELHHEPSGARMVAGETPARLSLGHETRAPESLPPDRQPWPKRGKPITGDIVELPHPGRPPSHLAFLVAEARIVLAAICDHVRQEADAAYLAERPELAPGHGYSDDTGSFAAFVDGGE